MYCAMESVHNTVLAALFCTIDIVHNTVLAELYRTVEFVYDTVPYDGIRLRYCTCSAVGVIAAGIPAIRFEY